MEAEGEVNVLEEMHIKPLGGGQEVGRSCVMLQFKGRTIMFDCGTHPGKRDETSLPYFEEIEDPADIDIILITHFHIDHSAALPYFTEKTNFRGRIFMTHATKAVIKLLLSDNLKLQEKPLYSEQDIKKCIDKIEVIDYHQSIEHRGIRFTATAAGHVLGAAMFMVEIDGRRVLYTGDYSMEDDRHLIKAELPSSLSPDVLIVESTFGNTNLASSKEREALFTATIENIVAVRGGSCLIPVFALGRAQELLLILDDYWESCPHLADIPVFYASQVASKALRIYQTFINMMNWHIRSLMDVRNPFKLRHISHMKDNEFDTVGPCVVMASPGMLQSGVSRRLLERWCDDERNGVIIAGYTVEGTLADDLLEGCTEIKCVDNKIKPRRCQIEHISFAAHVDFQQNTSFIRSVKPDHIILVHGRKTGMRNLKKELDRDIVNNWELTKNGQRVTVTMPENKQLVKLPFRKIVTADVIGAAASQLLTTISTNDSNVAEDEVNNTNKVLVLPSSSLLVTENFISKVVTSDELSAYTSCRLGRITQRMLVPIPLGVDFNQLLGKTKDDKKELLELLMPYVTELFDNVVLNAGNATAKKSSRNSNTRQSAKITIHNQVSISLGDNLGNAIVEWVASPMADLIADSLVGALLQIFSVPSILRQTMNGKRRKPAPSTLLESKDGDDMEVDIVESKAQFKLALGDRSSITASAPNNSVKKMRTGQVDPSTKIEKELVDHNGPDGDRKLLILKEKILQNNANKKLFGSIELSHDHTKLIFRGKENSKKFITVPEAFVFILWNDQSADQHEAVVQSADDKFREAVLKVLSNLT